MSMSELQKKTIESNKTLIKHMESLIEHLKRQNLRIGLYDTNKPLTEQQEVFKTGRY